MSNAVSYAERSFTLAAGASLKYDRQATFVDCLSSSATFKIKLDNAPESDFSAGLQFEPVGGFSAVEIRNPSATAALTLTLGFGIGNMRDNRVTLNSNQILPMRQTPPDKVTGLHNVTIPDAMVLLVPANPLRKEVIIQISDSFTGSAYINSNSQLGYGPYYKAGTFLTLETTAALYAGADNPTGGVIYLSEIEWSS